MTYFRISMTCYPMILNQCAYIFYILWYVYIYIYVCVFIFTQHCLTDINLRITLIHFSDSLDTPDTQWTLVPTCCPRHVNPGIIICWVVGICWLSTEYQQNIRQKKKCHSWVARSCRLPRKAVGTLLCLFGRQEPRGDFHRFVTGGAGTIVQ